MSVRYWDNVDAHGDSTCGCWLQRDEQDVVVVNEVRSGTLLTAEERQAWVDLLMAAPKLLEAARAGFDYIQAISLDVGRPEEDLVRLFSKWFETTRQALALASAKGGEGKVGPC